MGDAGRLAHLVFFRQAFCGGRPHDTPEVIHAFVVKKFQDYIAAHPSELREPEPTMPCLRNRCPSRRVSTRRSNGWSRT